MATWYGWLDPTQAAALISWPTGGGMAGIAGTVMVLYASMLGPVVPEAMEEYADSEVGLIKDSKTMHYEEVLTPVLFVVKVGPDCYKDEKRFPNGPWCKKGDFVLVRPHSGSRLVIHGREFRIINDDSVEAVVEDPRGITRAA